MSLQAIIIGSSHAGANVAYNLRKDGFNGKIDLLLRKKYFLIIDHRFQKTF